MKEEKRVSPLLSILIPTIEGRENFFNRLTNKLTYQINEVGIDKVQLLYYKDKRGEKTTGAKRNVLIEQSKGKFIVFVDDDDSVSNNYVSAIVGCIENNPDIDAIGIQGIYTENGSNSTFFETGLKYNWEKTNGWYTRTINHISPILRKHAITVKFDDITFGEDYKWTMDLKATGLLKKDFIIKDKLYFYEFITNK